VLSKNSEKIIEFLLRHPSGNYNVNQIAREVKISVGSAHKILKTLESKKILKSEKFGNSILYRLNLENPETKKLCEISFIESKNKVLSKNIVAKVYAVELEKFSGEAVALFGSILTKKESARDVDVLFVIKGRKDVKKVNEFCLEISKTKTKPVVPLIMTKVDLVNKIKEANPVILDIIKTAIIVSGENVIVEVLLYAKK